MSNNLPGVSAAVKSNGSTYYRSSITHNGKHISLGSFDSETRAALAYNCALSVLRSNMGSVSDNNTPGAAIAADILSYDAEGIPISFSKWVMLINLRDNGIYCRGPIYLRSRYFDYYIDTKTILRFGAEELFYYTNHTIQKRGGHLFVSDYGSQLNILNRYGIPSYAVKDRDYYFKNGDEYDFRPGNIVIINKYHGVFCETIKGRSVFTSKIHAGSSLIVGHYDKEIDAAIAYNKAADTLRANGFRINFTDNYIEEISDIEYRIRYGKIKISKRIKNRRPGY